MEETGLVPSPSSMLRQACAEPSRSAQHKSLRMRHPRSEGSRLHQEFILSLSKETQAEAVKELFKHQYRKNLSNTSEPSELSEPEIRVIGIRHGEKMYETLLTKEECAKAEDMGNWSLRYSKGYRVPADNRGLNYDKFFREGDTKRAEIEEFNSDNTYRLNLEETKEKIASLEYIQKELSGVGNFVQ